MAAQTVKRSSDASDAAGRRKNGTNTSPGAAYAPAATRANLAAGLTTRFPPRQPSRRNPGRA